MCSWRCEWRDYFFALFHPRKSIASDSDPSCALGGCGNLIVIFLRAHGGDAAAAFLVLRLHSSCQRDGKIFSARQRALACFFSGPHFLPDSFGSRKTRVIYNTHSFSFCVGFSSNILFHFNERCFNVTSEFCA
jgi:hypothetical protein